MSSFEDIFNDPSILPWLDNKAVYGMEPSDLEELQLYWIRRRFEEMRPKVRVLDRLADEIGIDRIDDVQDVTSLCLPHTMYKSYAASYVEEGRYDRMTQWLSSLTALDLSSVDALRADSLDSWLDEVEAKTDLEPLCSSGTSGKISFFPRSRRENDLWAQAYYLMHSGFRDEADSRLTSGELDYFTPWPVATGRHNLPNMFKRFRKIYKDKPGEHFHTLGQGHWSVDMLWLSGRMRAAEKKGADQATLKLSPALERIREKLVQDQAETQANIDNFIDKLMVGSRGQKIFFFAPKLQLIALAQECERRGLRGEFAPGSYFFAPGRPGSKGLAYPDGWLELCKRIFPYDYQESYGMTEMTALSRRCPADHFHLMPWVALFLLDPDSGVPFPRTGVQTGRLAVFDILPTAYWGGAISGDRVTIDWRGDCPCGRKGPFIHNDIVRYINLKDDDKITCARSADAYEKATEFILGAIPD